MITVDTTQVNSGQASQDKAGFDDMGTNAFAGLSGDATLSAECSRRTPLPGHQYENL
jgi:hypothetical protein